MAARTIDWSDGAIVIIDQTRLPFVERFVRIETVDELIAAIQMLAVRGAMALGVAGALGVALAASRIEEAGTGRSADTERALSEAAERIAHARPTAVNLPWGVARALAVREGGTAAMIAEALRVRDEDIAANRAIGDRGARLLAGARSLLTHCNAGALAGVENGTALSVVRALHEDAGVDEVLVCETRPLLQGSRLTSWELGRMGVVNHVIVDAAASGLIVGGRVQAVVVGADRVTANGDVANKVGTLGHALSAQRAGVPFIVAVPESTIDAATPNGGAIEIEQRDASEVLSVDGHRIAAEGTLAYNPAFDVTPSDLVSAIVTERRVIRASRGERPDDPDAGGPE